MQQTGKKSLQNRPRSIDAWVCCFLYDPVADVYGRLPRTRPSLAMHLKFRAAHTGVTNQAENSHLAPAVRRTGRKKAVPTEPNIS